MLPVIAIVGRPNVGKSTLFNALTRSRQALVADEPGVTRDRQYGFGGTPTHDFIVVDTGGLSGEEVEVDKSLAQQTMRAIEEAHHVLFMVDVQTGVTGQDEALVETLRRLQKPVWLVVNKTEGMEPNTAVAEFHALGLGEPHPIAAKSKGRVQQLMAQVLADWPEREEGDDDPQKHDSIKLAVVGRPNVGKSTLINKWLGEERVVALDKPGTTRDSVYIPFDDHGRKFTLIDTAGVRRRAKISDSIEKFSVVKTLQAIDDAHVVVMLLDAQESVTDQDAGLLGLILDRGRACVIAVNKWDGTDAQQQSEVERTLDIKFRFLDFADIFQISALHGTGIGKVLDSAVRAHKAAFTDIPTAELNELLEQLVQEQAPPRVKSKRPKLRYAHQGGKNPPLIVIHGSGSAYLRDSYKRFLEGRIRKRFKLKGTPIKIEMRD